MVVVMLQSSLFRKSPFHLKSYAKVALINLCFSVSTQMTSLTTFGVPIIFICHLNFGQLKNTILWFKYKAVTCNSKSVMYVTDIIVLN